MLLPIHVTTIQLSVSLGSTQGHHRGDINITFGCCMLQNYLKFQIQFPNCNLDVPKIFKCYPALNYKHRKSVNI